VFGSVIAYSKSRKVDLMLGGPGGGVVAGPGAVTGGPESDEGRHLDQMMPAPTAVMPPVADPNR